jgi:NAD(P)H-dependent flavin oxidoreductase YrpB (nitropropane dioxygenase family)
MSLSKAQIRPLYIGDLKVSPPIIQGGMGVRVSRANLASAVANEGCVGVIATAGSGQFTAHPGSDFAMVNEIAQRDEIRKARSQTKGIIGANIMVALSDYDRLVSTAVDEKVDVIISGAGLPFNLPGLAAGTNIKLIPIVSSVRTYNIICTRWKKTYNRLPDAVIIEGMNAGGHLGYSVEQITEGAPTLEQILKDVLEYQKEKKLDIPVIVAGGIFDGGEMRYYMERGASGVQMATRFVCTHECDVHQNFKQAYLDAKKEDVVIIKSPVGLPGRVIRNAFVDSVLKGVRFPFKCKYQCLKTCDPSVAPYCIARVLADAAEGKMEQAFAFAGSNVYRCNEIISVKELIQKIIQEYADAGAKSPA